MIGDSTPCLLLFLYYSSGEKWIRTEVAAFKSTRIVS